VEKFKAENGRAPTPKEAQAIRDNGVAVAVPKEKHQQASPTYRGRNTKDKQQADAVDPATAVDRDTNAMVEGADDADKAAAASAADKVKEKNTDK
jgi:filamentous hemagglutinin